MKSGVIYGNASCIDGMIDRLAEEMGESPDDVKVVATGGLARVILPECRHNIIQDDELLLKGLKIIATSNISIKTTQYKR